MKVKRMLRLGKNLIEFKLRTCIQYFNSAIFMWGFVKIMGAGTGAAKAE